MTNFVVYMLGMIIVAAALAYGASLLGVSTTWITVGVLVLLGLGLMTGIVRTRHRDPA
jgi:small basic protein